MFQSKVQASPSLYKQRSSIPLVLALSGIGVAAIVLEQLDPLGTSVEYFFAAVSLGVIAAGIAVYLRVKKFRKAILENSAGRNDHDISA